MVHLIATLLIANALKPTPDQTKAIGRLEDKLMAPCCYSQTIRVHMSAEAEQMREEVTGMVLAGQSEQEIIQYYKAKYGETILVVPDGMAGHLVFGIPISVALSAFGLLAFGIRRTVRRRTVQASATRTIDAGTVSPGLIHRIRRELGEEF